MLQGMIRPAKHKTLHSSLRVCVSDSQSVPPFVVETGELAEITLEYRQEVSGAEVVESMCMPESREEESNGAAVGAQNTSDENVEHYTHLLRLQDTGKEINRGRTVWRMRSRDNDSAAR